jgi:glyoxylase-like metal-dependent hydrolase (beta-lactamase superfamily II)
MQFVRLRRQALSSGAGAVIETADTVEGRDGLRLYRIEAEARNISAPRFEFDPLAFLLDRYPTPTSQEILRRFPNTGSPVGPTSFRVACHVISLPDMVMVIDVSFHTTADEIFPAALEEIARREGRRLPDRPLRVLYTHAHFDHAGGKGVVEALEGDVRILAHPYSAKLFPIVSRREGVFRTRSRFFRDCGIAGTLDEIRDEIQDLYREMIQAADERAEDHPFSSPDRSGLRVDDPVDPELGSVPLAGGRIEILRFEGHIPGHLCVLVDREHLITGDMWLPATTSTLTPGAIAAQAGVPEQCCGLLRYAESSQRLLDLDVDTCRSYPGHEHAFHNPKRMAMRDLELFEERLSLVYQVLAEHTDRPMRVIDLAWGGERGLAIWKLDGIKLRLMLAHDEANALVQDLHRTGDLREVEPERYLWTGQTEVRSRLAAALGSARRRHGHLEFRSRAR